MKAPRCPACNLPLTHEEASTEACPACGVPLPKNPYLPDDHERSRSSGADRGPALLPNMPMLPQTGSDSNQPTAPTAETNRPELDVVEAMRRLFRTTLTISKYEAVYSYYSNVKYTFFHRKSWNLHFPDHCARCAAGPSDARWLVERYETDGFGYYKFKYSAEIPVCQACKTKLNKAFRYIVGSVVVSCMLTAATGCAGLVWLFFAGLKDILSYVVPVGLLSFAVGSLVMFVLECLSGSRFARIVGDGRLAFRNRQIQREFNRLNSGMGTEKPKLSKVESWRLALVFVVLVAVAAFVALVLPRIVGNR